MHLTITKDHSLILILHDWHSLEQLQEKRVTIIWLRKTPCRQSTGLGIARMWR